MIDIILFFILFSHTEPMAALQLTRYALIYIGEQFDSAHFEQ